jgi:hypothetical protein
MKNLSLETKIEIATKLAVDDVIEKSCGIKDLEFRKKLIIKFMANCKFEQSVKQYLKLIEANN